MRLCSVVGCDRKYRSLGFCVVHYNRFRIHGDASANVPIGKPRGGARRGVYVAANGYAMETVGKGRGVRKFVHRIVMESIIGRPLLPEETVHHKNGERADNRPENLELWSSRQPKGQRIQDKVAWAQELLALYEPAETWIGGGC
jgi:hypothetical protein